MKTNNSSHNTMHSQVMKMLPWYVNRSVNQHEKQLIDTHLQSCVSCRIELKHQQRFAEKVKHSSDFELAPKQSFSSLKSRIHQSAGSKPDKRKLKATYQPVYSGWLDSFRNTLLWPQTAFAVLGFCLMLFSIDQIVTNRLSVTTNQFRTLSTSTGSEASNNDLRVVFDTTVESEQIKHLVSSVQGNIIEGPSPNGVFRIRIQETQDEKQISPEQAINLLRKHKQVVFVEPTYSALNSIHRK